MSIDQDKSDARQTRIDTMIDEFRAARQRRLVTRGVTRSDPADAAQEPVASVEPPPPDEDVH
jgi:hypothetical protein